MTLALAIPKMIVAIKFPKS